MLRSMTGFARSKYESEYLREYVVEIKSVNNRYNDINIKMSRSISYLEEVIRKAVLKSVTRGKIEVYIGFVNSSEKSKKIILNEELAEMYIAEMKKLSNKDIVDDISIMEVVKFPEVINIRTEEDDEEIIKEEVLVCLNEGIKNFVQMREFEGERIREDIEKRIGIVSSQVEEIERNV